MGSQISFKLGLPKYIAFQINVETHTHEQTPDRKVDKLRQVDILGRYILDRQIYQIGRYIKIGWYILDRQVHSRKVDIIDMYYILKSRYILTISVSRHTKHSFSMCVCKIRLRSVRSNLGQICQCTLIILPFLALISK